MKRLFFFLITIFILSCHENNPVEPSEGPFRVMLRSGFKADSVALAVDGETSVSWGALTSNDLDSVAASMQTSLPVGKHTLTTTVLTDGTTADTAFTHSSTTLFIVVDYLRTTKTIKYTFSNERPAHWPGS